MNKAVLAILAFLTIGYMGCKQESYKIIPPSLSDSYFPETTGSTWKYRDSTFGEKTDIVPIYGVKIDTLTFTINGATTDFNNDVCYNADVISKLNGASTAYFYSFKHLHSIRESIPPFGLTNLHCLVDSASVGYSWATSPTASTLLNGNPAQTINTIEEKNITKVINGKTFTNVIHASVNYQININNTGWRNIAFYDFYLAKGVGVIEKDTYVYGNLNGTRTIIDYTIK
jgi:hypothetical protein